MPESINVSQPGTNFIQLVDRFGGAKESDHHLRLKDGDEGKVLYVHSKNHGLPHKRAEIMERRFQASQEVLKLFRDHYSGSTSGKAAAEKVISHLVRTELGTEGSEEGLQLRGSDILKMYEKAEREMTMLESMSSKQEPFKERYPSNIIQAGVAKLMGIDLSDPKSLERLNQTFTSQNQVREFGEGLEGAIKDRVGALSVVAQDDSNVQKMCSGTAKEFRQAIWKHQDLFGCSDVLDAPELKTLRPLIVARLAFEKVENTQEFQLALNKMPGSAPIAEPPQPETGGTRLFNNRMDRANHSEWTLSELEHRFFGETNQLGLHEEAFQNVVEDLGTINQKISDLKQQIKNETRPMQKEELALQLHTALNGKKAIMEKALDRGIESEQMRLTEDNQNPISDVLKTLETEGGRVEGEHLRDVERGRRDRTQQHLDFLKS